MPKLDYHIYLYAIQKKVKINKDMDQNIYTTLSELDNKFPKYFL